MGTDTAHDNWVERNPLRQWRKTNRITILRAAGDLEVSITSIQSWEQGAVTPSDESMEKLADRLSEPHLASRWAAWLRRRPSRAA